MGSESRCDGGILVCGALQINVAEESLALVNTSNNQCIPQWVEFGSTVVHDSKKIFVDMRCAESMTIIFAMLINPVDDDNGG